MATVQYLWAVWYITQDNTLSYIDYIGTLDECVNIVRARYYGVWALIPYDPPKE